MPSWSPFHWGRASLRRFVGWAVQHRHGGRTTWAHHNKAQSPAGKRQRHRPAAMAPPSSSMYRPGWTRCLLGCRSSRLDHSAVPLHTGSAHASVQLHEREECWLVRLSCWRCTSTVCAPAPAGWVDGIASEQCIRTVAEMGNFQWRPCKGMCTLWVGLILFSWSVAHMHPHTQ